MIIGGKINCAKIDKDKLFTAKDGVTKYLDIVLMENRDGPDKYGTDGMICQSVSKEERAQGIKGAILGNFKFLSGRPQTADQAEARRNVPQDETPDFLR